MRTAFPGLRMLKLLIKLRPVLLLASLVMLGVSGPSFAGVGGSGPDWRDVALAALGIVSSLVSAWATFMQLALTRLSKQLAETRELVLSEYQTADDVKDSVKAGVQEAINPLSIRIAAIGARLGVSSEH